MDRILVRRFSRLLGFDLRNTLEDSQDCAVFHDGQKMAFTEAIGSNVGRQNLDDGGEIGVSDKCI